ncbi:glycogen/starch/alpha-glucan phosphorylase [Romeria aff. gracilis LEGE 07310]|uniref:Alpha-1,4 glucan phosphorylase n=1 Tax=Vasconcelosia minhoensis LEGE 07310 TaxID=915328 RepID=A0A8J7A443_9CYAN|nr:glycogen/starch/alpha-glucan phosphorylase [Romeria gracilis]MBE9075797.1 glycogen/starch/alpha-glucan phosphorylase [Romeria aff. gracilis LEGE 07310]
MQARDVETSFARNSPLSVQVEDDRTGLSLETLKRAFLDNLFYVQGKSPDIATAKDYYMALAYTVRDRMLHHWLSTGQTYRRTHARTAVYLSAEFLMGPYLGNNLINLGLYDLFEQAMEELGLNLKEIMDQEQEPGLGNGGLGRLAACYLDSMATLEIPSLGYGIRYEFGIFEQAFHDGWQVEKTDQWLRWGNPWEVRRPEWAVHVKIGGHTEGYTDHQGRYQVNWVPDKVVRGIPYDTPILGYQVNTANTLRLWRAESPESFDFDAFNRGDYYGAVNSKIISENISKVLYPNDDKLEGKQLRLEQEFFFVSCSLQDMIRLLMSEGLPLEQFPEKFTVQLNDTHPAVAIAELMRLLVDDHEMAWDLAWEITQKSFAYTNHTLLPEALERWPMYLFGSLLPRHLEIIFEINRIFLDQVRLKFGPDNERIARMSLIEETGGRYVRMANLACVGSHAINGVAELHTELLKETVLKDFYELFPEKFVNKTNGVTPRRWMVLSNPRLAKLIDQHIGTAWPTQLDQLSKLEAYVDDPAFRNEWREIKQANKRFLTARIERLTGIKVNPDSMFDVQIKRIHEYKRQQLNALHIITLYRRLKQNPDLEITPRTFIFAGKAAPGYFMAKLIIKLITAVGDIVNRDPVVRDRLKVVFIPNYNVTNSQPIYPASDLSEQISTAGFEASGTGNMKFALNGSLTIGTLDGANVEIREEVGAENFFLFGMTADEVTALKASGYQPWQYYEENAELKGVIDLISSGFFSGGDTETFKPLIDNLLQQDRFTVLADYQSYIDCQDHVGKVYQQDQENWLRMSILNAARMGKFSSDRAVREYCKEIWHVDPVSIELQEYSKMVAHIQEGAI